LNLALVLCDILVTSDDSVMSPLLGQDDQDELVGAGAGIPQHFNPPCRDFHPLDLERLALPPGRRRRSGCQLIFVVRG
jgi:hypothetical protein